MSNKRLDQSMKPSAEKGAETFSMPRQVMGSSRPFAPDLGSRFPQMAHSLQNQLSDRGISLVIGPTALRVRGDLVLGMETV